MIISLFEKHPGKIWRTVCTKSIENLHVHQLIEIFIVKDGLPLEIAPGYIKLYDIIYKEEAYKIIGLCMEVHNNLGKGFLEIVYKDALEYEFRKANIPFSREKEFVVNYKEIVLPHKFYADFVVLDKIILEVKGINSLAPEHIAQTLNYLKVSNFKLGLLVNFGELRLVSQRIVL